MMEIEVVQLKFLGKAVIWGFFSRPMAPRRTRGQKCNLSPTPEPLATEPSPTDNLPEIAEAEPPTIEPSPPDNLPEISEAKPSNPKTRSSARKSKASQPSVPKVGATSLSKRKAPAKERNPIARWPKSKKKADLPRPSEDAANIENFATADAKLQFEGLKNKKLLTERGFDMSGQLPDYITEVIAIHKWQKICSIIQPIVPLVREFYANVGLKPMSIALEAIMREKRAAAIPISIDTFNQLERSIKDAFNTMVLSPMDENFERALEVVGIEDAQWDISTSGVRTLRATLLKPAAHAWLHFFKSRLLPTTHDTTVSEDKMLLLYCTLVGRSIDAGLTIWREIETCSRKRIGKLFFPSLITQLCIKARVPFRDDEEMMFERRVIDIRAQQQRHGPQHSSDVPSTSACPLHPQAPGMVSFEQKPQQILAQQAILLRRSEIMEVQLHTYWKFAQ